MLVKIQIKIRLLNPVWDFSFPMHTVKRRVKETLSKSSSKYATFLEWLKKVLSVKFM